MSASDVGRDFGRVPMGAAQVAAAAERCTCLRELMPEGVYHVNCPQHGLKAFLRERLGGTTLRRVA